MIPSDALDSAYPLSERLSVCSTCGKPLSERCQRRLRNQGLGRGVCRSCYNANRNAFVPTVFMSMNRVISSARRVPPPRRHPQALRNRYCCGWLLRVHHDTSTERHHNGINRYMRDRYWTDEVWQQRYLLGSAAQQREYPKAIHEVARLRRMMLIASGLAHRRRERA